MSDPKIIHILVCLEPTEQSNIAWDNFVSLELMLRDSVTHELLQERIFSSLCIIKLIAVPNIEKGNKC